MWHGGFQAEAASANQSVVDADSVHRQRLVGRSTHAKVSVFVGHHAGFLLSASARTQSVIVQSSCEAEQIAATAATSEAKYIQALFLACGQHVNIHLSSDITGAIGVAAVLRNRTNTSSLESLVAQSGNHSQVFLFTFFRVFVFGREIFLTFFFCEVCFLHTPRAVWEFPLQTEENVVKIDGLSDADAASCTKT